MRTDMGLSLHGWLGNVVHVALVGAVEATGIPPNPRELHLFCLKKKKKPATRQYEIPS